MENSRITRDAMLAEIVATVAKRSTCNRAQVGALIALDGRILSLGYAGSPIGLPHCHDIGCLIDEHTGGCQRTIHAEANTIAFAARNGIAIAGADLWCSYTPCLSCAKLIANSGIKRLFCLKRYRDPAGVELLGSVGISVQIGTFEAPGT